MYRILNKEKELFFSFFSAVAVKNNKFCSIIIKTQLFYIKNNQILPKGEELTNICVKNTLTRLM